MDWKQSFNAKSKPKKKTDVFAYLNHDTGFAVDPQEYKRMKNAGLSTQGLRPVLINELTTELIKDVMAKIKASSAKTKSDQSPIAVQTT